MGVLGLLALAVAPAPDRILLVPLDSRPAAGQFAQMIGRIGGAEVRMPPYETLGRFTDPGRPEAILDWLESQDLDSIDAIVASTDMLAYGGLIASRVEGATVSLATTRLKRLAALKKRHPQLRLFAFSATMRLAPTATREAAPYRMELARLVELEDRLKRLGDRSVAANVVKLRKQVPELALQRYLVTRNRNHKVQQELIRMVARRELDYLIVGQDDAKLHGPHVMETAALRRQATESGIAGLTYFCEGIDQHSNILVSRAVLKKRGIVPRVNVVYSDPEGAKRYDPFESKPIFRSLEDQIYASGARPAESGLGDYTLFLNVPKPRPETFAEFGEALGAALDRGDNVAVANIDFGVGAVADPRVVDVVAQNRRAPRLLSYAGWNTAGNTMGTAIPAANLAIVARRGSPDRQAEVARTEFLLHRLVNDHAYHKFTRPLAYRLIDATVGSSREETTAEDHLVVNSFVRRDLSKYLGEYFRDWFFGETIRTGEGQYRISGINESRIWLPWPRAYEVRLEFRLESEPISSDR